jgi:hypothetical protein
VTDTLVALGSLWTLYPALHPDLRQLADQILRQRQAEGDAGGVRELREWLAERGA